MELPAIDTIKEKIKIHHLFLMVGCIYISLSSVSYYSGFLALFSLIFFYLSYIVGEKLYYNLKLDSLIDNTNNNTNKYKINYSKHYKFGLILLFIGILFIFFNLLWVRGVPLFDPASRRFLNVPFTALSRLLLIGWAITVASNLNMGRLKILGYSLIFSTLIMLLGYRTNGMILLLSMLFVTYYSNRIKTKELIYSSGALFLILIAMSLQRLYTIGIGGIPLISRIDLTMSVFDIIVKDFNGVFLGLLHYSAIFSYFGMASGARTIIANNIGVTSVSITPTIFGAVIGDYGILGIIPYFGILGIFLGLFYKIAEKLKGVYLGVFAIVASYLIVSIETGLLDFDVLLYYLFGFILCIYISIKSILISNFKKNGKK